MVCRSPAVLCTASDGALYCSTTTGLCVQLTAPTAAVTIALPPTIRLVGQAVLGVTLGSSYLACPTPQPTNVICDRSVFGLTKGLRCWAGGLCPPPSICHLCLREASRGYMKPLCTHCPCHFHCTLPTMYTSPLWFGRHTPLIFTHALLVHTSLHCCIMQTSLLPTAIDTKTVAQLAWHNLAGKNAARGKLT